MSNDQEYNDLCTIVSWHNIKKYSGFLYRHILGFFKNYYYQIAILISNMQQKCLQRIRKYKVIKGNIKAKKMSIQSLEKTQVLANYITCVRQRKDQWEPTMLQLAQDNLPVQCFFSLFCIIIVYFLHELSQHNIQCVAWRSEVVNFYHIYLHKG